MGGFKAAYLNEMYKISKKKKIVVSALLYSVAIVLAGLIESAFNNFAGIRLTGSGEFSIMVLSVLSPSLLTLFTAFVCIDMFSGEYSNHTMKFTLTRPVSRLKVYTSKVAAAGTFILLSLAFIMVVSLVVSAVVKGINMNLLKIMLAYTAASIPVMVFALLVTVIANIAKGPTSAFMLTILIFLILSVAPVFYSAYKSFFFTSMFGWYNLFVGSHIVVSRMIRVFFILCGSGLMLFASGYYLFDKKDI